MNRCLLVLGLAAALAACGGEALSPRLDGGSAGEARNIHAFANACFTLRDAETGDSVGRSGGDWLTASGPGSALFFKPTGLGHYLLMDAGERLLGLDDPAGVFLNATGELVARSAEVLTALGNVAQFVEGGRTGVPAGLRLLGTELRGRGQSLAGQPVAPRLAALPEPTDLAIWALRSLPGGTFGFQHAVTGLWLVAVDGRLALIEGPLPESLGRFRIDPATGCTPFPEAELNVERLAEPRRLNPDGTVFGWVDAHNHIMGSEFLGGRVPYGASFHRLGITRALGDCSEHHGPLGLVSPLQYLVASNPHDTQGWPRFRDWPNHGELLHHQTYHRWMKRAFLSGQKLMVNHFVENEGMCSLHSVLNRHDCDERASILHQRRQLYALQDYIDAQEGGPGKGWFRIVTSPAEARAVIANGQMAVVMGAEVSKLLGCGEQLDQPLCTLGQIRERLDELDALGLRSFFPIHRQDNAFGGAKPGELAAVNAVVAAGSLAGTFHPYRLEACETDPEADQNARPQPGLLEALINAVSFFSEAVGGPALPGRSGEGELCNARGLTVPHGEFLIDELMRRGRLIEIDHTGERVRDRILAIARERDYPVVAGHSWTSPIAYRRIWALGGALNHYSCDAECFVKQALDTYAAAAPPGTFLAVGLGTDANGLGPLPGPRASAAERPLTYPFVSRDGAVRFHRQVTGERVFDLNTDGVAHYGLYADLIADIAENGGERREEALELLFRSAERYLQMWEKAEARGRALSGRP